MTTPRLPSAPRSIQKGVPLKDLLGTEAIDCLVHNISLVYPRFQGKPFRQEALEDLEPLALLDRSKRFAKLLRKHLPPKYEDAVKVLLASLTSPLDNTEDNGLAVFFYLPHVAFVAEFGLDAIENDGEDPFEISMKAQFELTQRFSAEFSIRPFLVQQQERTLQRLLAWTTHPDTHVRRLCSEGTRPRLPWATRIPAFLKDPTHTLPILEALKDDESLYVRRSVANHLGDIAKDHPEWAFALCERWLVGASNERKWLIRHALRHPAKKKNETALQLRIAAKAHKTSTD